MAKTHRSWMSAAVMVSFVRPSDKHRVVCERKRESSSIETPPIAVAGRPHVRHESDVRRICVNDPIREDPAAPDVVHVTASDGFSRLRCLNQFVRIRSS
jgi:hypothetical protein